MMRNKKILFIAFAAYCFIFAAGSLYREKRFEHASLSGALYAEDEKTPVKQNVPDLPQAESPRAIYIVMTTVLIIWIGLALFIFNLDRKVARIEKNLKS